MKHLVLIGFMASGKSTLASYLSASLNLPIFSTDQWIQSQSQSSISQIFSLYGEGEFRLWEKRAFEEICSLKRICIIDCGGGFVLGNDVRRLGRVYYLRVGIEEITRRLREGNESAKRPLAKNIQELYVKREEIYQSFASRVIEGGREQKEIAKEVLEDWKSFSALLPIPLQQDRHK